MNRFLALAVVLISLVPAIADEPAILELPDGRRVEGTRLRRQGKDLVLETSFGELRVPRAYLDRPAASPEAKAALDRLPAQLRVSSSRWFLFESDLSERRVGQYLQALDGFVDRMAEVYGLNPKRLHAAAPFGMTVYRSRLDFKQKQTEVAPGMATVKGRGFAEGVAGFFSQGHQHIWMWDVDAWARSSLPEVAFHEMTHWLNYFLRQQTGAKFPVWFEEGTATYFEMWTPGVEEPEPNLGALGSVLAEVEAGTGYTSRTLRSVPYATFYGREYSWGCSFVYFLRIHRGGRLWPRALDHLRTVGDDAPSDSEQRRFLSSLGFNSDESLDAAWFAAVRKGLRRERAVAAGASSASLASVAAKKRPSAREARLFARMGHKLASLGRAHEAIVYYRAALRGGEDGADLHATLASMLAVQDGRAEDEPWPEAAVEELGRAVARAPTVAAHRTRLGRQCLLAADTMTKSATTAKERARSHLGLALLLAGPQDDVAWIAAWALRAAALSMPNASPDECVEWLVDRVPLQIEAIRRAQLYALQEAGQWEELLALLERRRAAGEVTPEQLAMLAGLLVASDRAKEAISIFRELLARRGENLHLWPGYVRALVFAGDRAGAEAAKLEAWASFDASTRPTRHLRRAIERLLDER